jgi:trehalose-phosphatase
LHAWLATRPTLALFLDYDGTLTPIVDQPEAAVLAEAARDVLRLTAQAPHLDITIVSGRALADLRERVGLPGLTYVGNHGFEIEGPGISHRPPGLDRHLATLQRAADDLAALAVPGARVERKGATVSFHVRGVADGRRAAAENKAATLLRRRHLTVPRGKLVVEGRPPLAWGKGHAVLHVLAQRHGATWPARVRALYIGDDATDQDAFRSLRGIGRSIFVGQPPASEHGADHTLPDPAAVLQLVRRLSAGPFADLPR